MIEKIIQATQEAAEAATGKATAALRRSAYQAGWPGRAAASLRVNFESNSWKVTGSSEAADQEYGGPGRVPNAAVRRFRNHSKVVETAFLDDLATRLKGLL